LHSPPSSGPGCTRCLAPTDPGRQPANRTTPFCGPAILSVRVGHGMCLHVAPGRPRQQEVVPRRCCRPHAGRPPSMACTCAARCCTGWAGCAAATVSLIILQAMLGPWTCDGVVEAAHAVAPLGWSGCRELHGLSSRTGPDAADFVWWLGASPVGLCSRGGALGGAVSLSPICRQGLAGRAARRW
jgi:hypothetical protein